MELDDVGETGERWLESILVFSLPLRREENERDRGGDRKGWSK
jgi:hypothetical protein